jgi:hypothetical protein
MARPRASRSDAVERPFRHREHDLQDRAAGVRGRIEAVLDRREGSAGRLRGDRATRTAPEQRITILLRRYKPYDTSALQALTSHRVRTGHSGWDETKRLRLRCHIALRLT